MNLAAHPPPNYKYIETNDIIPIRLYNPNCCLLYSSKRVQFDFGHPQALQEMNQEKYQKGHALIIIKLIQVFVGLFGYLQCLLSDT